MQPADEGPCASKMCRQQRGPYGSTKPFQSKRLGGKPRSDRSAVVEVPLFGDGHHFTFHPEEPHHFQPPHHYHQQQPPRQRPHQLQEPSVAISSSSSSQQHRLPCETRPSSRIPTSTSAPAANASTASVQQRRAGSGGAEPRFSPDCTYSISSGGFPNSDSVRRLWLLELHLCSVFDALPSLDLDIFGVFFLLLTESKSSSKEK